MKSVIIALVIVLFASIATAADVHLKWDAPDTGNPTGYKLYFRSLPGIYTESISVGPVLEAVVSGLTPGKTYWFVATALYPDGESGYSNEVSKEITVLFPPGTLTITKTEQKIEATIIQPSD